MGKQVTRWDSVAKQHTAVRDDHTVKREFRMLLKLAAPTIVQTASQQAMAFTDQIFLGHLGTDEMAAAAMGNMYAAFLTFFLLGTATALDTLGSQAYGAAKRGSKGTSLVTWCFTSFVVLTTLCIPATVGLTLGYPVARGLLGQDRTIARLVGEFCAGLIPGIWPMMWSVVLMKYLQVQNVVLAPAVVAAATFVLNIGANFLFIDLFGFKGAPWATSFSRFIQFLALCAMVYYFEHTRDSRSRMVAWIFQGADDAESHDPHDQQSHDQSHDQSRDAADQELESVVHHSTHSTHASHLKSQADSCRAAGAEAGPKVHMTAGSKVQVVSQVGPKVHMTAGQVTRYIWEESKASVHPTLLWTYLKLGLPGGVMMSCEQGAFDVTTAMAAHLGPVVVSAHSAMINVVGLTFVSCPFAVGIAGSIRVGNLLGEAMPRTAKKAGWLCVAIGSTFMAVCAVVILATKDVIGRIFTTDPEVIAIVATIVPFVVVFQVSDGLMGCSQGVLRGCGKQRLIMVYNIVGFWLSGVLLGYLLCFHAGMGVRGLWVGIATGDSVTALMNIVTLSLVNWQRESQTAQQALMTHDEDSTSLLPSTQPPSDMQQQKSDDGVVTGVTNGVTEVVVKGGNWEPHGAHGAHAPRDTSRLSVTWAPHGSHDASVAETQALLPALNGHHVSSTQGPSCAAGAVHSSTQGSSSEAVHSSTQGSSSEAVHDHPVRPAGSMELSRVSAGAAGRSYSTWTQHDRSLTPPPLSGRLTHDHAAHHTIIKQSSARTKGNVTPIYWGPMLYILV